MVDFRKWLFALAPVGLLLGIGSVSAYAQGTMTCTTAAGVPNIIRAEGVTELLGDLIINCINGAPTLAGQAVPLENFQITINANVTSRIQSTTTQDSEGLLMIDEPWSVGNATTPYPTNPPAPPTPTGTGTHALTQLGCLAVNSTNCAMISKGVGVGPVGNYDGTAGHFNIFQGFQNGINAIAWNGVPFDAPGTAGTRVVRITNVRANAFALGVSSTLIPTSISMIVAVNGSAIFNLNQPGNGNVVGIVEPGLVATGTAVSYQQCNNLNAALLNGTGGVISGDLGGLGATITLTATEGFAASFKVQDYDQILSANPQGNATITAAAYKAPDGLNLQNIPGFNYVTETGFYPGAVTGLDQSGAPIGLADHGTQIQFSLAGVPAGVSLFAPSWVTLTGSYGNLPAGLAVLVGSGAALPAITTPPGSFGPSAPVTISGGAASLVYEIYYDDPSVLETLSFPVDAAWITTGPTSPPPTTSPVTVAVNFAPLSTVATATTKSLGPIPRFGQPHNPSSLFSIVPCTCNLLFPFVTNIAGFDTGVAIANTTQDPYGTAPQSGTVTLNYYGTSGGGAAPAAQTSTSVPAGSELIFTLSSGGNYGITSAPGFEGYIIAVSNFQYCHGFAFISDVGAQKLAEGYLAIQLDVPGLNRTLNVGENEGN